MISQPLNIIEFITHPELLNDQSLSVAQQTFLKSTYGLALNSEEREIYQRATGRSEMCARRAERGNIDRWPPRWKN